MSVLFPNMMKMIEILEHRRLLAVTADLVSGTLTVTGDDTANHVGINVTDGGNIVVRSGDAVIKTVAASSVTGIKVSLLGGDDSLLEGPAINKPTTVSGGAGNDNLTTGAGNDIVNGDAGNDVINAGPGNDALNGGDHNDMLIAGPGADVMSGGGGVDTASYADRTTPVVVTLDNLANDGTPAAGTTPGEGDNVTTD